MTDLGKCPDCGGKLYLMDTPKPGYAQMRCCCGARGPEGATDELAVEVWRKLVGPPRSPDDPRLWAMLPDWVQFVTWGPRAEWYLWAKEPTYSDSLHVYVSKSERGRYGELPLILDHGDDTPKMWRRPYA